MNLNDTNPMVSICLLRLTLTSVYPSHQFYGSETYIRYLKIMICQIYPVLHCHGGKLYILHSLILLISLEFSRAFNLSN